MEKTSNTSVEAGDTFRGPSGYEDVTGDAVGPEGPAARLLGLGGLVAALLVCAVVFVEVPAPSSGGANTHGLALRCADNSACAAAGEVGDCCPEGYGKRRACCGDATNVARVAVTAPGACDDHSACAAAGLAGACCPAGDGADLACCSARGDVARASHAVSSLCAHNPACAALGIAGRCCPTDGGATLACCPPVAG